MYPIHIKAILPIVIPAWIAPEIPSGIPLAISHSFSNFSSVVFFYDDSFQIFSKNFHRNFTKEPSEVSSEISPYIPSRIPLEIH